MHIIDSLHLFFLCSSSKCNRKEQCKENSWVLNCLWPCGVLAKLSVYLINKTRSVMCGNSRLQLCGRDLQCAVWLRELWTLKRTQLPHFVKVHIEFRLLKQFCNTQTFLVYCKCCVTSIHLQINAFLCQLKLRISTQFTLVFIS